MTQRKPPGVSWESWTEQQIRRAQEEGEFDDLAGAGEPLPDLRGAYDPLWWVKKLVQREHLSVVPPALQIRATVEQELEKIWTLADEEDVRARVAALNTEIAKVNATTTSGPATTVAVLDVEATVEHWRGRRRNR
jgi:DnaJ-like protein